VGRRAQRQRQTRHLRAGDHERRRRHGTDGRCRRVQRGRRRVEHG
jgi:hypothetical protein